MRNKSEPATNHDQHDDLLQLHAALDMLAREAGTAYTASQRYRWVEILLLNQIETPKHIGDWLTRQDTEKPIIERGLDLYEEMASLILLCEPDGPGEGPACRVRLIDFDKLSAREIACSVSQLTFVWRWTDAKEKQSRGVDLLMSGERELYELAKKHGFNNKSKPKPTLQSLAAETLTAKNETAFNDGARRFVRAINRHTFAHANSHRDRMIRMVNTFGGGDRSPVAQRLLEAFQRFAQSPAMIETTKRIYQSVATACAWMNGPEGTAAREAARMAVTANRTLIAPVLAELGRQVAVTFYNKAALAVSAAIARGDIEEDDSEAS